MTVLVSPEVIISYPALFKPKPNKKKLEKNPNAAPEFSAAFLFTQEAYDSAEGKALRAEVERVAAERFGRAAFETMVKEDAFDSPFKKDISAKKYPPHVVRYITSASGQDYPPQVVGRETDPATGKPRIIKDPAEIYAGAKVRVSLSARAYGGLNTGNKAGVKLDLRNVQKLADGERLVAGSSEAVDDFGKGEAPAAPASLGSLLD